ncbi:hypothetical protein AB0M28_20915 [Streptomyces sp. NPDC051940]|uniref:hypothetical protein n=1 Tax=Streptomyces sp. NPDC051940 TaxID=3155675 RepID=UPI0034271E56
MAVTRQLARLTPEYLDRCRRMAPSAPDGDLRCCLGDALRRVRGFYADAAAEGQVVVVWEG